MCNILFFGVLFAIIAAFLGGMITESPISRKERITEAYKEDREKCCSDRGMCIISSFHEKEADYCRNALSHISWLCAKNFTNIIYSTKCEYINGVLYCPFESFVEGCSWL